MACLGRVQGRLADLVSEVTPPIERLEGVAATAGVSLALVAMALGDDQGCRSRFEMLASREFDELERDQDRLCALAGLSEVSSFYSRASKRTRRCPLTASLLLAHAVRAGRGRPSRIP